MAHDILIVDDERDIRLLTSGILEDEGYQTREAGDSTTALASIESRQPSLVLLDIWLKGSELDGLGILKIIKQDHPYVPVVIMSGHGTIESAVAAIKDGAYDFIEKPFAADRLVLAVTRAIDAMRLKRENEELRLRAGTETQLVGRSPAINQVRQIIERVAPANSRVLITGPAGSGKEVVARMLHARSRRAAFFSCCSDTPSSLSCRCRVRTEVLSWAATSSAVCAAAGWAASNWATLCTSRRSRRYCSTVSGSSDKSQAWLMAAFTACATVSCASRKGRPFFTR